MKRPLLILGLLLLTACTKPVKPDTRPRPQASSSVSSSAHLAAGETKVVYDDAKTKAIHQKLHQCLSDSVADLESTPNFLKARVYLCDKIYWEDIQLKKDPPTFYALSRRGKGPDPFEDFVLCVHTLANPMNDLPSEVTAGDFRESIHECLSQYPKKF